MKRQIFIKKCFEILNNMPYNGKNNYKTVIKYCLNDNLNALKTAKTETRFIYLINEILYNFSVLNVDIQKVLKIQSIEF